MSDKMNRPATNSVKLLKSFNVDITEAKSKLKDKPKVRISTAR